MLYTRHDLSLCCAVGSQLVGDHHPRKPEIKPDRMSNQFRWKTMTAIERITSKDGRTKSSQINLDRQLTLQRRRM
jgi:hypothetical protein